MISVIILTHNEEQDLPGCLDSVAWCDDIHVMDSGSTDRTVEIATARGARVSHRPFDGYASQRNASLGLAFKHDWIFVLDADERPTPELSREMLDTVTRAPADVGAYRVRRRDFLCGRWLKHAQMTPFYIRLLRRGRARYAREVNEVVTVDGSVRDLRNPLDHLAFSKGIAHWIAKHNSYSTREAQLLVAGDATRAASLRQALFAPDFHDRRIAQKAVFYALPLRPVIKWAYLMFVRGAILDGSAGITYAALMAFYELMIDLKARELRTAARR